MSHDSFIGRAPFAMIKSKDSPQHAAGTLKWRFQWGRASPLLACGVNSPYEHCIVYLLRSLPAAYATAALLAKVAKHLAVLTCLAIVGRASGRFAASQTTILIMVIAAVCLHAAGRALQRRCADRSAYLQVGP